MKLHLNLNVRNAKSEGLYDYFDNSITVLKGSVFERESVDSFSHHNYWKLRQEIIDSGLFNSEFVLLEDKKFSSLSAAAAVILGRSANGSIEWKLDDNKSFRDYAAELDADVTLDSETQKEKYINDFLEDIDILNELNINATFNIFETLQIVNKEIRHSNLLAWLLNPNETHSINNFFIKKFIRKAYSLNKELFQNLNINPDDIFLWDFNEVDVLRESNNIDILIVDKDDKFLVVIENKIDSREGKNQLIKYRERMESKYPEYKRMYLFLTKTGYDASDLENWGSISYEDIAELIEQTIPISIGKIKDFIEDYHQIIRRYIMTDEHLINTVQKIYQKHKKALDLIYEYRPDNVSTISDYIKEKALELNNVVLKHSIKNYVRLSDEVLERINDMYRDIAGNWLPDKSMIMHEITINKSVIKISTEVGPSIDDSRNEIIEYFNKNKGTLKTAKENTRYTRLNTTDILKISEDDELDSILDKLDKVLIDKIDKHINVMQEIFSSYSKL